MAVNMNGHVCPIIHIVGLVGCLCLDEIYVCFKSPPIRLIF